MPVNIHAHIGTERFKTTISNQRNELIADEPLNNGGGDMGFSPSELLCSALAACTSITLRMYADRKKWSLTGMNVNVTLAKDGKQNVTNIIRDIELIGELSDEQKLRLLDIANQCPLHKTLNNPIHISTQLK